MVARLSTEVTVPASAPRPSAAIPGARTRARLPGVAPDQVPQPLRGTLYPAQYEVLTGFAGLVVALTSYVLVLRRHRALVARS